MISCVFGYVSPDSEYCVCDLSLTVFCNLEVAFNRQCPPQASQVQAIESDLEGHQSCLNPHSILIDVARDPRNTVPRLDLQIRKDTQSFMPFYE